jgi:DNA-binding beta-propeller fold protein YncE
MKHAFFALFAAFASAAASQTPTAIEAVEYDPAGRWFVTNGATILETADAGDTWGTFGSVGATHGMEVVDGHLFALDNGVVRAVDLASESVSGSLSIPGTSFLNGMGSRPGELIVSDFGTGALHRVDISNPAAMSSSVLVSDLGVTPNGVVIDEANNRAIVVTWGACKVLAVDLTTASVSTLVASTGLSNCDGIDLDGAGLAYVSSWSPNRITRFAADFSSWEPVVTTGLSSPADISYAVDRDTLAVANSGSDVVTFHGFAAPSGWTERWIRPFAFVPTRAGVVAQGVDAGAWSVAGMDAAGRTLWDVAVVLNGGANEDVELASRARGEWDATWLLVFVSPEGERTAVKRGPHRP